MSLSELDAALSAFIVGVYNKRPHSQTGETPDAAWLAQGWLPRLPESLDDLDLLLLTVAEGRTVQRDGIRFQGLRYIDPTLASYVGEAVMIRYDPRDLSEIRVFHGDRFLCRAVSAEHAGQTVTLKDIQTARVAHRRALRAEINARVSRVTDYLPVAQTAPPQPPPAAPTKKSKLRTYLDGD